MSNSNSWNLENLNLSEDKINKNIKEISKQLKQDVNFLLNLIDKYDSLELLRFIAFHTDDVLEKSKINKNLHNEEVAYSQVYFILKFVASNPNKLGKSKDLSDFSWKKFNRNYSNFENHLIKYTDNLILKENIDSSVRSRMQEKFYSYMFPIPRTKFENISNKKKQLKLLLQPFVDKINATFNSGLDNVLDSLELMAKVGTKGIYDLNKDCDLFAKRSQSKIDELKTSGSNKSNKELLEQIISEEGWQNWISSLQSRSEGLDLFDVQRITKMDRDELEMLSVAASSQYSANFCWLTESAGLDDSLFIKVNDKYYSFDCMFIFDKAYHAIKKAVIKKFPSYENTWNSVEKEKSGLLPVSILAGVFGHFTYSLDYEAENSCFTAFFENEKNNVYVQVPKQHGYNLPLNPIKEIVITEFAYQSYDLAVNNFDKIDDPIVVLDSLDEKTDKIIEDKNVYYISYSYLASILNEWNEIRLLRDTILGASPENIEKREEEKKPIDETSKIESSLAEDPLDEIQELKSEDNEEVTMEEETDEELEYLEELFDEDIEEKEIAVIEEQENDNDNTLDVVEGQMEDLFNEKDGDPEKKESLEVSKESNSAFSFFDVLNNVAQGKEPLNERSELAEDDTSDDATEDTIVVGDVDLPNGVNTSKRFSMTDVLNNVAKGKQPLEKSEKQGLEEIENLDDDLEIDESSEEPVKEISVKEELKPAGFSFFDVLNNVAGGKSPLTGTDEQKEDEHENETEDDKFREEGLETIINTNEDEIVAPIDINEVVKVDLDNKQKSVNLSNIENLLDDDDDDFIDEEEISESVEVERSDDNLRAMFDDDLNDEREFLSDDLLSDVELTSIVEPEDEDEEVQEIPIDDGTEEVNEYLTDTKAVPSKAQAMSPINVVNSAEMMNSVNEILSEIDDSDLDDYGNSSIDDEESYLDESEELLSNSNDLKDNSNEVIKEDLKNKGYVKEKDTQSAVDVKEDSVDDFIAIEKNRIIEEEIPTLDCMWPSTIVDIVGMSEELKDSPFFNICKVNDIELMKAIDYLIGKAINSQKIDGKDKMFTIPESNLTIVIPTNKNDQLKKWERMNSLGALMYSKDKDSWNALTLNYNEDKKLNSIREWSLSKDSYSPVDWKFVVTTGSRLKRNNNK